MSDMRRVWMAGVWMAMAIVTPVLIAGSAWAQTTAAEPPGTSIPVDRAWGLAHERDATNIVSIIAGAELNPTATANVGESVEPLPSVSVDRVLGEARFARVRGIDPKLSTLQLDGDRLPSIDMWTRATPLDILPGDFFELIQVSRTLRPDMDGDAIGGAINLVPRRPTEQMRGSLSLNGGYRGLRGDADELGVNGMFGRRFADGRVGIVAGASSLRETLSGNGFDASWSPALTVDTLTVRSALIDRTRAGGQATIDVKASDRSTLVFSGVFGRLHDHTYERQTMYLPHSIYGNGISRALFDQPSVETLGSASVRGQQMLRGNATLDFRVTGAHGQQSDDDMLETLYGLYGVTFNPNFNGLNIDPNNIQPNPVNDDLQRYTSLGQTLMQDVTKDTSLTGAVNVTVPIGLSLGSQAPQVIKFGVKARTQNKSRDRESGSVAQPPAFSSVIDQGFEPGEILDGRYTLGATIDPALARQFNGRLEYGLPGNALFGDYSGHERVLAGYVMAPLAFGSRLTVEPGVRYEWTRRRYNAWSVLREWEPTYDITPRDLSSAEGEWLPMVSARYAATARTTIRLSVTRTFARPNFGDLAPYANGALYSSSWSIGNPDLRSTKSWNSDVMVDQELAHGSGRLFAGLFHKRITDPVYSVFVENVTDLAPVDLTQFGGHISATQPRNGDRASLTGVEVGYEQPLRFLPGALAGLRVSGSYTFSDSSATVPWRTGDGSSAIFPDRPGHDVTLTGLPRHLGHVAVSYDHGMLSARLAVTMQSRMMLDVGTFSWEDVFTDRQTRVDVSLTHRLTTRLRAFADIFNLTNAPTRWYVGETTRPFRQENYGRWATFGVRMLF